MHDRTDLQCIGKLACRNSYKNTGGKKKKRKPYWCLKRLSAFKMQSLLCHPCFFSQSVRLLHESKRQGFKDEKLVSILAMQKSNKNRKECIGKLLWCYFECCCHKIIDFLPSKSVCNDSIFMLFLVH